MNPLVQHIQEVRAARQVTNTAIKHAEMWASDRGDIETFTQAVTLYVYSLNVHTVQELADIEARAVDLIAEAQDKRQ